MGLIIGLVVGLAVAVGVALYITHAPLPFVNKVQRPATKLEPVPGTALPDPNKALSGVNRVEPAQARAAPESSSSEETAAKGAVGQVTPETKPATAGLPATQPKPATVAAPAAGEPKASAAVATAPDKDATAEPTRYQLQAGAYKAPDEADAMLARVALLGQQARIFPIEQGGQTLYRVRLGPYGQLNEANRVRKLLADNSIDSQIVRLK